MSPVVMSVPFVFGSVYVLVVAVLMLPASNAAFFVLSVSSWIAKPVSVTVLLVSTSAPVKVANLPSASVLVYPVLLVSTVAEPIGH